jgi:hypothetical protein
MAPDSQFGYVNILSCSVYKSGIEFGIVKNRINQLPVSAGVN